MRARTGRPEVNDMSGILIVEDEFLVALDLEDIVAEAILHESSHLNRFAGIITMIAAVAPLLGLLGTVTGMIQTFDVITDSV